MTKISRLSNKLSKQALLKEGGEPTKPSKKRLSPILANLPLSLKNKISDRAPRLSYILKDPRSRLLFFGGIGKGLLSLFLQSRKRRWGGLKVKEGGFRERLAFISSKPRCFKKIQGQGLVGGSLRLGALSFKPSAKSNKKPYIFKHNTRKFFQGALIIRNRITLDPNKKFSIFKACTYFLTVKFFSSMDSLILVYNIINVSALFLYFRARIDKQVRPFFKKKSIKSYFNYYDFSTFVRKRVVWARQNYQERKEWWAKFRMKFFKRTTYKLASLKIKNIMGAADKVLKRRQLALPFVGSFLNKIFTKAKRRWRR